MIINFGKYRGIDLSEIPESYLTWVLETVDLTSRATLRGAIRSRLGLDRPAAKQIGPDVDAVLKATFRTLALDFHPDRRRGSCEAMVAINVMNDRLRKAFQLEKQP